MINIDLSLILEHETFSAHLLDERKNEKDLASVLNPHDMFNGFVLPYFCAYLRWSVLGLYWSDVINR